ncbi:MAG: hypothetical protein PHV19_03700, partial [Bacilli bacterium]|nr:hypothetical protein [Bacilli bacterium]
LESSGKNTFINGASASNDTLFSKGDTFGVTTFNNFTFNGGSPLGYTFTVSSLSNTHATININKI